MVQFPTNKVSGFLKVMSPQEKLQARMHGSQVQAVGYENKLFVFFLGQLSLFDLENFEWSSVEYSKMPKYAAMVIVRNILHIISLENSEHLISKRVV